MDTRVKRKFHRHPIVPIIICILLLGFFADKVLSDTLSAPGTPGLQVGPVQDNKVQVTVSWTATTGDVKGYKVYRGIDVQNLSVVGTTEIITEPTLTYTDSVDQIATKYYYYVTAYDQGGIESPSSGISSTYIIGPNASFTLAQNQVVSIKPLLQVAFDQDMDPSTVNTSTVIIKDDGGNPLTGTVITYSSSERKANLSIFDTLLPNKQYVLEVTTGVKNASGLAMSIGQSVNFATGSASNYPHGGYTRATSECSKCHSAHEAASPELLNKAKVNDLCFVCHNGTQTDQGVKFGDTSYQNAGHFSGNDPANKSKCNECHTAHGSDNLKLLNGPYDMGVLETKSGYGAADQFFCANAGCHAEFNPLTADSSTSFKDTRTDPTLNLHYKHLANSPEKGNAVCYECHRPHGPIASEIDGADNIVDPNQQQAYLDQMNLIGFPSTSTVLPALGNSSPKFYLSQNPDQAGGGCVLSCHGVVHDINPPHDGAIDSRYEFSLNQAEN